MRVLTTQPHYQPAIKPGVWSQSWSWIWTSHFKKARDEAGAEAEALAIDFIASSTLLNQTPAKLRHANLEHKNQIKYRTHSLVRLKIFWKSKMFYRQHYNFLKSYWIENRDRMSKIY